MRKVFINTLIELAELDERIILLTGDLGFMVIELFAEKFPKRFFNIGVAEQNMVGIATGLAEAGFIPFLYSIAPFAVLRTYEFIRNGPIAHQLPVRIVGVGGGLEYSTNGISHYALEDIGILRIQPSMTIISPADNKQTVSALRKTWDIPVPIYYRLSKNDFTEIPNLNGNFKLGSSEIIRDGNDILIITTGNIALEAITAINSLSEKDISCALMIVSSFNPSPIEDIFNALLRFKLAVTIENHYITGGLGSLVAEVIAEKALPCRLIRCGIKEMPNGITGSLSYMYNRFGLSSISLETAIYNAWVK